MYLNRDPRLKRFQRFLRTDRKGDPLPPGGSPRTLFLYVRDAWLNYGHHGGLTPEEMGIPLCMYSFARG